MPAVVVRLPVVLEPVAAGRASLRVEATTVAGALEAAFAALPVLRHHLTEDGALRGHVLCLHNGCTLDRDGLADVALADGDEVAFHQAISGG